MSITGPWGGGAETMQFRFEAYNAFNHTQFDRVDTNNNVDPAMGNQLNPDFGACNGTQETAESNSVLK